MIISTFVLKKEEGRRKQEKGSASSACSTSSTGTSATQTLRKWAFEKETLVVLVVPESSWRAPGVISWRVVLAARVVLLVPESSWRAPGSRALSWAF